MMNKKAQTSLTKTGILLVVLVFYATIFVLIGYINSYFGSTSTISQSNVNTSNFFGFFTNVISGISEIPIWLNSILFGSLVIIMSWIVLSSLPTFNGGG